MSDEYSIEEILIAVNDIQQMKKNKNKSVSWEQDKKANNPNIPKNTLKLIEEAERSKS